MEEQRQASVTVVVDQKGGPGVFTTVQAAVNSVPDHSPQRTVIIVKPGTYREKVHVEPEKMNITLRGENYQTTSIVWDDNERKVIHLENTASVKVGAFGFVAYNISFRNTAPPPPLGAVGGQAVALMITGDQGAFYNCGFYGAQDTLLDAANKHYFKDCFIEGSMDFICGDGRSLYEGCILHSIAPDTGAITAQKRNSPNDDGGFSFVNCTVTGSGRLWLGRSWGAYSRVVFANTSINAVILPERWTFMNNLSMNVFFGEYHCSGPGASTSAGGKLWKRLTDQEAAKFLDISCIDGKNWILPPQVGAAAPPLII